MSKQPGDNYRVVATLKGQRPDEIVGVKQDDGAKAGVYFLDAEGKLTANPVPEANNVTVTSPLLTVWRHLTLERDHMGPPPAGEVFETEEPRKDVNPGGPIPDLDISHAQTYFKAAYIDVRDAGALNKRNELGWVHIWDDRPALLDGMTKLAASTRDVPNSEGYWAVQVIAAYEGEEDKDYDPPVGPPGPDDPDIEQMFAGGTSAVWKASVVFTEVVRDVVTYTREGYFEWGYEGQYAWVHVPPDYTGVITFSVAEGLRRVTYHELLHQFNLSHAKPEPDPNNPGDQGILDNETLFTGSADQIQLNPAQLSKIRWTEKPTDS